MPNEAPTWEDTQSVPSWDNTAAVPTATDFAAVAASAKAQEAGRAKAADNTGLTTALAQPVFGGIKPDAGAGEIAGRIASAPFSILDAALPHLTPEERRSLAKTDPRLEKIEAGAELAGKVAPLLIPAGMAAEGGRFSRVPLRALGLLGASQVPEVARQAGTVFGDPNATGGQKIMAGGELGLGLTIPALLLGGGMRGRRMPVRNPNDINVQAEVVPQPELTPPPRRLLNAPGETPKPVYEGTQPAEALKPAPIPAPEVPAPPVQEAEAKQLPSKELQPNLSKPLANIQENIQSAAAPVASPVTKPAPAKEVQPLPENRIAEVSADEMRDMSKKMGRDLGDAEPQGMWAVVNGKEFLFINKDLSPTEKAEVRAHELKHRDIQQAIENNDSRFEAVKQIAEHVRDNPGDDPNLHNLVMALGKDPSMGGFDAEHVAKELLADGHLDLERAKQDLADLKAGKHANQEGLIVRGMMEKRAKARQPRPASKPAPAPAKAVASAVSSTSNEAAKTNIPSEAPAPVASPETKPAPGKEGESMPLPSEGRTVGQQWDSQKIGTRVRWLRDAGYVTREGKLTQSAAKWAEAKWNSLSDSAKNVLEKRVSADFPGLKPAPEPAKAVEKQPGLAPGSTMSVGPGAQTRGEPEYPAIQQLTDQLKATPPTGTPQSLSAREKIADVWSQGKSATDKVVGRMRAVTETLKDIARGVRDINELDRKVGTLDFTLQQSSGLSHEAKRAIKAQMRNDDMRSAVGLWIDAGGDADAIRAAIPHLPDSTPAKIRRALALAADLPPEAVQFAQSLRQFFGIRAQDAIQSEVFDEALDDYYTHVWERESNMPDSLRAAISNGRVNSYFQFSRQRKIPTILEGILAGKVPKLDPADIVPYYNYLMDRAIASRHFVKQVSEITASDGRPALLPTGTATVTDAGGTDPALIINPKGKQEAFKDYRTIDHPALRKWKWAGTDPNTGKPTFYRSELAVHPEFHERLARMMDRGKLNGTQWGKAALRLSNEVKGFKLGLLSAFHQIHVGSHALFHWTLPFKTDPIDWTSDATRFAVEKGHLKLAGDARDLNLAGEGLLGSGLVTKIPAIGPLSKAYGEWLFGDYIPRLKLKTFQNAYSRALTMRDKLGAYKGLSEEQIASRIGDSVNNAYGELNHWFLNKQGRDPTFQRILRGIFLAPDFGEARLRFVEKAGTKFGHEERLALATAFILLYTAARIGNWLSHGDSELDMKNAFRVKVGKEWVSMRSVLGDVLHAYENLGGFMYARLNPLYSRTAADWLFSRDTQGHPLTFTQKVVTRPLEQLVPISMQGLTNPEQKLWESFVTSMGIQAQRDRPQSDVYVLVQKWAENSGDPRLKAQVEQHAQEVFAPSAYGPLRQALLDGNDAKAQSEYSKLSQVKTRAEIGRAMAADRPMAGLSRLNEHRFRNSLSDQDRAVYDAAEEERREIQRRFKQLNKE